MSHDGELVVVVSTYAINAKGVLDSDIIIESESLALEGGRARAIPSIRCVGCATKVLTYTYSSAMRAKPCLLTSEDHRGRHSRRSVKEPASDHHHSLLSARGSQDYIVKLRCVFIRNVLSKLDKLF